MLRPEWYDDKFDRITEIWQDLENFIIRDISRRLINAGEMTATADRFIWKLRQMGESREAILAKLEETTKLSHDELKRILQDAVLTSWSDEAEIYKKVDANVKPPLENPSVMKLLDSQYKKSQGELRNLTRTTLDQTNRDLVNLLDEADMRVASGMQSYSAAISDVLDKYAGDGVMVEYPTGAKRSIEAAVRCAMITSATQIATQMTVEYICENNMEFCLIDAHTGARVAQKGQPQYADHSFWQGRVFRIDGAGKGYPGLEESTAYKIDRAAHRGIVVDPLGFAGYNCRHGIQGFIEGMDNPWRDKDGNLLIGGKPYDDEENRKRYEQTQKQRAMERSIRKSRRELLEKQVQFDEEKDPARKAELQQQYDAISYRLTQKNKKYNDFCKENDLKPQYDRTKAKNFDYKAEKLANAGAKRYSDDNNDRYADMAKRIKHHVEGKNDIFVGKTFDEKMNISKEIVSEYTDRRCGWNGIAKENEEMIHAGIFSKDGHIEINPKAGNRTYIHEMLHAYSAPYIPKGKKSDTRTIEEASVELSARMICEEKNIPYDYLDNEAISALIRINEICDIEENVSLFAKLLYNMIPGNRLSWITGKINRYITKHPDDKEELLELLERLK